MSTNKLLISFLLLFSFMIFSTSSQAQTASDTQIIELLEVMNAEEIFVASIETMAEMQKDNPQTAMLPEGFYAELIKEAKAGFKTDLFPKLSKIYQNNLTTEEVSELIAFYKTDIGKLMLEKMPMIQAESANVGMQWGQQLGMQIAQKLMKEKE